MTLKPGQAKCIHTLDASLAVSAGAGSGKTFTLTRRIVHALSSGVVEDIGRVLAITFTSKAAAELKSRIKGALRAEGMVEQALKVDSAWISTIHGMCARILRAHALEVGIDPAFRVLGEAEAAPLLDAAVDEVLAGVGDVVVPAGLDALFAEYPARSHGPRGGGSVDDMVRALACKASANVRGMDAVALPCAVAPEALVRRMVEAAEGLMEAAGQQKPGKRRDELLAGTAAALEACAQAQASGTVASGEVDALGLLGRFPVPGRGFGTPEFKAYAQEVAREYGEVAAEARFGGAVALLRDVRALAGQVLAAYRRRKRQAGGLDNDDLLVETARAFERHPALAAEYAERFQLVMVDEFQDTDQLQVDMIKRMAGSACERLCTVGDAQQSIYRFRGADVSVYHRHVDEVRRANPEGVILLPDNFRSHADVLAFVDRVFEQPQAFGSSFMSLSAARDEARVAHPFRGEGARIDVQLVTRPQRGVPGDEACRVAARGIARRFAALREAGHAPGEMVLLLGSTARADTYADELRRAGFACVVVKGSLFNRAPEVQLMVRLAQALENPLDALALFEVLSSEMFALSADDFLTLSTVRDEQSGTLRRRALALGLAEAASEGAAARAPGAEGAPGAPAGAEACGAAAGMEAGAPAGAACAAPGEAAAAHAGASGVLPGGGAPAGMRLRHAARIVEKALRSVGRLPVSAIMEGVVRDSGWFSRLEAQGAEGQARAANVLKAIRMVEDEERAGAAGAASVAARFAERVRIAREAPGALAAEGGDFVRIMTVHASKGLEFPLVAVAELEQGSTRAERLLLEGVNGTLYASLDRGNAVAGAKESSLVAKCAREAFGCEGLSEEELARRVEDCPSAGARRAAMRALSAAAEEQETRRLLYVALTRAKEALVVSLSGKRTKDNPSGAKGIAADVQSALCGPGGVFPAGRAAFDFGGSRPAAFERVDLGAQEDTGEAGGGGAGDAAAVGDAGGGAAATGGGAAAVGGTAAGCAAAGGGAAAACCVAGSGALAAVAGGGIGGAGDAAAVGGTAADGAAGVLASGGAFAPATPAIGDGGDSSNGDSGSGSGSNNNSNSDAAAAFIDLYAIDDRAVRWDLPLPSPREDVFSYSSLAAAGGADAPDGPGAADGRPSMPASGDAPAAAAAGAGAPDGRPDGPAPAGTGPRATAGVPGAGAFATAPDDDAAAWAAIGASLSADAAATDLGTAFHRLAQHAACMRKEGGALVRPDVARVEALCESCRLAPGQRARLRTALDRWFSSSVAAQVACFADVRAEVPFFQALRDGSQTAYLEGEIDLLATDGTGTGRALVVDYKTGGQPDEDAARVREKHRLQATCYAYVVLLQGHDEVEAVFVRVEQPDAENPAEPQCVRYRFEADDLPALEAAILAARRAAQP